MRMNQRVTTFPPRASHQSNSDPHPRRCLNFLPSPPAPSTPPSLHPSRQPAPLRFPISLKGSLGSLWKRRGCEQGVGCISILLRPRAWRMRSTPLASPQRGGTTRTASRCCGGYAVSGQASTTVHTRCGRVECQLPAGWSGGGVSGGRVEGGGGEWERTGGGTPTAILHTTSMSTLLHAATFLRDQQARYPRPANLEAFLAETPSCHAFSSTKAGLDGESMTKLPSSPAGVKACCRAWATEISLTIPSCSW
jgi:hypothetical protein